MPKQRLLIGLSGFAGSGKNLAASLIGQDHSTYQTSFASPMKHMLETLLGSLIDPDTLWGDSQHRDRALPFYGPGNEKITVRHMLQTLGTEWGRGCLADDFWIQYLRYQIAEWRLDPDASDVFIITDVRFFNERDAIIKAGGEVWFIDRPQEFDNHVRQHASEREMQHCDFTKSCRVIPNRTTVPGFKLALAAAFDEMVRVTSTLPGEEAAQ